ncbi:ankyrin repeat domain-containing protein [Chaetoceros tenuissimus]|uniref:Ankyrin repeat domain-containing protein n=1 Tax=Chaetoceros tenuissimus TaxID=426638 RepID=A0AAD3H756_9STRA|nr:ankyrin repeat domain-containing protein [Chaetoceros tenuissimus]
MLPQSPDHKKQKLKDSMVQEINLESPNAGIDALPEDALVHIFSFIGEGSYRYIAPTSKIFRKAYMEEHSAKTFIKKAAYSVPRANIFVSEGCILYYGERVETSFEKMMYALRLHCAKVGSLDVLKWTSSKWNIGICINDSKCNRICCSFHNVPYIQNSIFEGNSLDFEVLELHFNVLEAAVGHGHLNVFVYLMKKINCRYSSTFCKLAAREGHLDCLRYLHENGCEWDSHSCRTAAGNGHLHCLRYLHENGCEWDSNSCRTAAGNGHLHCLRYLHENGCEWDSNSCRTAAEGGHLDCLRYLHENGCEWDIKSCHYAADGGHLDCLRYLHENGCEWDSWTIDYAAGNGHLDCLRYLHENGCEWDSDTCFKAAGDGHLDCLRYLHENGCEWRRDSCYYATVGGHLDCLRYLHENGCEWESESCAAAAGNGHLACLIYLHENGCEWNSDCYVEAAGGGHLDCLRYLHENGCERGEGYRITSMAGRCGHLACLKYLLECSFEFSEDDCFFNAVSYTCEEDPQLSNRLKTIDFIRYFSNMSNERFHAACALAD